MIFALAHASVLRFVRTPRAWAPVLLWIAFALLAAFVGRSNGADRMLRGPFSMFALPLVAYTVVGGVVGPLGLRRSIRAVVALGAEPRRASAATVLVSIAMSALLCGALAVLVCVMTHVASDPSLSRDLPTSLWVGALGGAAYASFFGAGSAIGKGGARGFFLAFDWILGSGFGALWTPRGHVRSLLGGPLCAELSQRTSSLVLVGLLVSFFALTLLLTRRI